MPNDRVRLVATSGLSMNSLLFYTTFRLFQYSLSRPPVVITSRLRKQKRFEYLPSSGAVECKDKIIFSVLMLLKIPDEL